MKNQAGLVRRAIAFFLGLVASLLLLTATDLVYRLYVLSRDGQPEIATYRYEPPEGRETERVIGQFGVLPPIPLNYVEERSEEVYFRPLFNAKYGSSGLRLISSVGKVPFLPEKNYRNWLVYRDRVIFDQEYQIDEFYRRIIPGEREKKATTRFLMMLGDSHVFGYALPEDGTLGYFLGRKFPNVRFYNYGIPGLFPGEHLDWLRATDKSRALSEERGTILYFFGDYYMHRSMLAFSQIQWGGAKGYYYEREDGEIAAEESIKDARPFRHRFVQLCLWSVLCRKHVINVRVTPQEKDYRFMVKIIEKVKREGARLGADQFYVVLYPKPRSYWARNLIPYLEEAGIRYIDYYDLPLGNMVKERIEIPYDGHYTQEAQEVFAEEISRLQFLFEDPQSHRSY